MAEMPQTRPSGQPRRRLYETVRHLGWRQLAYLLYRRGLLPLLRRPGPPAPAEVPPLRPGPLAREPFLPYPPGRDFDFASGQVTLLNLSQPHRLPVNWAAPGMPPLWQLELGYFHWLTPAHDPQLGLAYMVDWLDQQEDPPVPPAWNPFGVAQRVLQWTRLLAAWHSQLETHPAWPRVLRALYRQGRFLAGHQEFEFLGNHLLKTAVGWYAAGCFFATPEAAGWRRRAGQIILGQARAQTLGDGGHYERSPMYHLMVVHDLLDVLNLTPPGEPLSQALLPLIRRQVAFARDCAGPGGQLLLTNDSMNGQAATRADLLAYAAAVTGEAALADDQRQAAWFPDFGLARLNDGPWEVWVDSGRPGPDFLLAHAHADLGGVLAWWHGQPLLVEAGVYCYGGQPARRDYDRNAYGHNVLLLDAQGDCECWREFRVGRRPRRIQASYQATPPSLQLSHDGLAFLPGAPRHERRVSLVAGALEVRDTLAWGRARPFQVELPWHLAPEARVTLPANGPPVITLGATRFTVHGDPALRCELVTWPLARRFYEDASGPVLRWHGELTGPVTLLTRFVPLPAGASG